MCAFVVFKHKGAHYKCLYNNNNNNNPQPYGGLYRKGGTCEPTSLGHQIRCMGTHQSIEIQLIDF